ncbi:GRB2-associated-binding protein 2 [Cricetulus griseus]|nr:GRB2-associated-binding protein 2 [Cricetulus griseus]
MIIFVREDLHTYLADKMPASVHVLMYYRSISTQSIINTDSGDSKENCVPMQNPMSSSPVLSDPAPKKSPSTSFVTLDEKGEYVQVDKKDPNPTKDQTEMDKDVTVLKTFQKCQAMGSA